jgi:hypothetical protein
MSKPEEGGLELRVQHHGDTDASMLIEKLRISLLLLELFSLWDTAREGALDLLELLFGLQLSGLKLCLDALVSQMLKLDSLCIERANGNSMQGQVQHLDRLTSEQYLEVMRCDEIMGDMPIQQQEERIQSLFSTLRSPETRDQLVDFRKRRVQNNRVSRFRLAGEAVCTPKAATTEPTRQHLRKHSSANVEYTEDSLKSRAAHYFAKSRVKFFVYILLWWLLASVVYTFVNDWAFYKSAYYR